MAFYVGQKVERYREDDTPSLLVGITRPPIGKICTVTNVYTTMTGYPAIELAEYPKPQTDGHDAGWHAGFFRPIIERKTDISIFTAMLTPKRQSVDA